MTLPKKIGLLLAPVIFLFVVSLPFHLVSETGDAVIAVAIWMIIWWITEVVNIAVTALLPLILFPLLKIMPASQVGSYYGSPIIFLFFGGFVLALALEKVNLHKRIALSIIRVTGVTPNKVVLGFMIASAFMSMWISNTASTVVMLPIAISVIRLLVDSQKKICKAHQNFALSIMLGIAFSANAGGVATVIGTPPNSVLIGLLENEYGVEISFLKWMILGLPFSIVMVCSCYLMLVKVMFPCNQVKFATSSNVIELELTKLGKISSQEKRVLSIFTITVFLWITRTFINHLFPVIQLSDTTISLLGAFAVFVIPMNFKKGTFILHWDDTRKLAWGILLLFGGGLALAKGMASTGLVDMITVIIKNSGFSPLIVTSLLIVLMLFMTELMSNVALVAVLAPIVAGIAIGLNTPILNLLVPVTMASSCAFMLPMATPPNAIVFASGYVKVNQMLKVGVLLNFIAVGLLILYAQFVIPAVF